MTRALLSANGLNFILAQLVATSVLRREAIAAFSIVGLFMFYVLHGPLLLLFFQLISDRFKFNRF